METVKGRLQSKTYWGIAILALTSWMQLIVANSDPIQAFLMGVVPAPWNQLVPLVVGIIVTLATILGVAGREDANEIKLSGLWRKSAK